MVSTGARGINAIAAAVTDRRLSTVVPAEVTGDSRVHELADMDLAMKLHYLRVVHYFPAGCPAAGLTVPELKYPMFRLLEAYYPACGRIRRRSESGGRPVVKCNDSGVRVVEARCELGMDEWLAAGEHRHVVPDKVLGPEMHFSPLVVVQVRLPCFPARPPSSSSSSSSLPPSTSSRSVILDRRVLAAPSSFNGICIADIYAEMASDISM